MIFEKVKSQIVSHLSYKIGSEAEAVVVDPQRDCRVYVDIAQQEGLQIKHIRARGRSGHVRRSLRYGEVLRLLD